MHSFGVTMLEHLGLQALVPTNPKLELYHLYLVGGQILLRSISNKEYMKRADCDSLYSLVHLKIKEQIHFLQDHARSCSNTGENKVRRPGLETQRFQINQPLEMVDKHQVIDG